MVKMGVQILGAYAIGAIAFLKISNCHADPRLFLICIPPALLTIYLLGVALFAGFVNPILSDDDREWWARSSGYLLFTVVLWLIVFAVSLCADIFPGLLGWFLHGFCRHGLVAKMSGFNWASATTAISGLLALLTRDSNVVSPGASKGVAKIIGSIVLETACPVFIVALVFSLSVGETLIGRTMGHPGLCYLGLFIVLVLVAATLSCVVNVNRFSLHNTYRNRLIRTFLGASHRGRKPNSFTGFCERDNFYLKDIKTEQRPYHVICGTVNLHYPELGKNPPKSGVLFRVYPDLEPLRNELPADVLNFTKGDPAFPSDQLANQWYGEAQFESYRKLGREIGMRLFAHKDVSPIVNALSTTENREAI